MALFAHLDDNFFLPFSRANKHFHEACLLRIYERFYKETPRFPRNSEVISEIYETLRNNPDFLSTTAKDLADLPEMKTRGRRRASIGRNMGGARQEVVDAARNMAVRTYENLIAWGWLEEEKFGIVVTVDMSPGGLAVMETLHRIRDGFALAFSGTLVQLNLALDGIRADPRRNAPSLWNVRRDLESFVRHLRAILADLKRIRSEMIEGEGQRKRTAIFFESFVKRLLLKDFAAIHTTNHPYRYKAETLAKATRLAADRAVVVAMAETYAEHEDPEMVEGRGRDNPERQARMEAAEARVAADFEAIHGMLSHVDAMFERIRDFQEKLEGRLRNMLRYKSRGRRNFADRLEAALDRLVSVCGRRRETLDQDRIPGYLDHYERPFAVHLQARPARERQPVGAAPVVVRLPDPVDLHLQRLKKAYLRRLHPSDERIRAFLDQRLEGRRMAHASELVLETIDDFLAFDALHLMLRRKALPPVIAEAFALRERPGGGRVDNAYMACDDFVIARRGAEQDAA